MSQDISTPQSDYEKNITQEIRFAVVFYGGVSLCVYMGGVAQELLSLVRSTADINDNGLTSTISRKRWPASLPPTGKPAPTAIARWPQRSA